MRTLPQSGLSVPSNHPVLVDGLDSVGVELDALEEVLQEAADEHLFIRQRGPRWIARHRLEVTCARSKIFIHFLSRFGCTCLLQAAQEETSKDCFCVEIVRLPPLTVGAKVEDRRVVR